MVMRPTKCGIYVFLKCKLEVKIPITIIEDFHTNDLLKQTNLTDRPILHLFLENIYTYVINIIRRGNCYMHSQHKTIVIDD